MESAAKMVKEVEKPLVYPVDNLDRSAEIEWLATSSQPFAGEWVALSGSKVIAHGPDGRLVFEQAQAAGVAEPFLVQVPAEASLPFAGW